MGESFIAQQIVYATRESDDGTTQNVVVDVTDVKDAEIEIGFDVDGKRVYLRFRESDYRRAVKVARSN